METVSIRTCAHCGRELPTGMRKDALTCNSSCRAAHSRKVAEMEAKGYRWVKGYWREIKPRPAVRRQPRKADPALTMICAALLLQGVQRRSEVTS